MGRVLIVEPENAESRPLAVQVREIGHEPQLARSFGDALQSLSTGEFDVLLLEVPSEEHENLELVRRALEVSPRTRPVVLSPSAERLRDGLSPSRRQLEILAKPCTSDNLQRVLREVLESPGGVYGTLYGVDLLDILQMLHFSRRSLTVRVGAAATIHLREGEIVHAEVAEARGEEALLTLLAGQTGAVRTAPPLTCATTIDRSFDALLLDLLRVVDEQRAGREPGPERSAIGVALTDTPHPALARAGWSAPTTLDRTDESSFSGLLEDDPPENRQTTTEARDRAPRSGMFPRRVSPHAPSTALIVAGVALGLLVPATMIAIYLALGAYDARRAEQQHPPLVVAPTGTEPAGAAGSPVPPQRALAADRARRGEQTDAAGATHRRRGRVNGRAARTRSRRRARRRDDAGSARDGTSGAEIAPLGRGRSEPQARPELQPIDEAEPVVPTVD